MMIDVYYFESTLKTKQLDVLTKKLQVRHIDTKKALTFLCVVSCRNCSSHHQAEKRKHRFSSVTGSFRVLFLRCTPGDTTLSELRQTGCSLKGWHVIIQLSTIEWEAYAQERNTKVKSSPSYNQGTSAATKTRNSEWAREERSNGQQDNVFACHNMSLWIEENKDTVCRT
jgi:hypothetical protein